MHVDVKLQLVGLCESLSAVLTHTWLFLGMCSSHVTVMRRVRGERLPTVAALKWLFSTMLTNVGAQDGRRRKRLYTVWTFVRSLTTVNSHVLVEAGRLRESFCAHATLVRPVFLMDVKHVNA